MLFNAGNFNVLLPTPVVCPTEGERVNLNHTGALFWRDPDLGFCLLFPGVTIFGVRCAEIWSHWNGIHQRI